MARARALVSDGYARRYGSGLRDEQLHGRGVARVGVYEGALERRRVPSVRADLLCDSKYGAWIPDTCGPLHTRIASKSFQCGERRRRPMY